MNHRIDGAALLAKIAANPELAKRNPHLAPKTGTKTDPTSDGFDSNDERLFVEDYLKPGGWLWLREPVSIRLDDGSGERYIPDFYVYLPDGSEGHFVEVKPHKWVPKEGRLGISKMKRGAAMINRLFDKPLFKASRYQGQWWFEQQ